MAERNTQIAYRRIKGRIVPIRIKRDEKLKRGFQTAAVGVAAGVATAELASRATKQAATYRVGAQKLFRASNEVIGAATRGGQMVFDFAGNVSRAQDVKAAAAIMRNRASILRKARKPILAAGTALSAYLLGKGLENIQESASGKELGLAGEGVAQVTGGIVSTGVLGLYYKRLGLGSFRKALTYAKAAASGAKDTLPRIPIKTKYGTLKF